MLCSEHDVCLSGTACGAQVPQEQLAVAATSIRQHMEGAVQLQVPLRVKLHVGASWGSLQELLES